jgi:hypothetical protein
VKVSLTENFFIYFHEYIGIRVPLSICPYSMFCFALDNVSHIFVEHPKPRYSVIQSDLSDIVIGPLASSSFQMPASFTYIICQPVSDLPISTSKLMHAFDHAFPFVHP